MPQKAGKSTQDNPGVNTGKTLTPKQQRFVDEYLIDLNATQAAIRAGYAAGSADVQGTRLLGYASVIAAIQKGNRRRQERTEITQDRVLQELYRLAFVDIRKFFNADGTAKAITELDDDAAAALAGFEVMEMGGADSPLAITKKFKLSEKKGAIELLMRHMGMLNDKLKLQGDAENPLTLLLKQVNGTALPVVKDAGDD
jgi:phage terminase small subunit